MSEAVPPRTKRRLNRAERPHDTTIDRPTAATAAAAAATQEHMGCNKVARIIDTCPSTQSL
jgi:hypothetical protein